MKFQDTGLPRNKLIEDAFDYSYATVKALEGAELKSFNQQINAAYAQHLKMLEADKEEKIISEDQYNAEKEALEKNYKQQLHLGPAIVKKELENMFKANCIDPALEIMQHSDNAQPEMMAAVLVMEAVRSPIDFQEVQKKFGNKVAGLVAHIQHIDAHTSERETLLDQADSKTKTIYMAMLVATFNRVVAQCEQFKKMNPPQRVIFPPGQEEYLFNNAKHVWGNDKKLDKEFLGAFNRAAAATGSLYTVSGDPGGDLELVKNSFQTPPRNPKNKPPGPGGNGGGLGDDVF